jgi:hypothetical protein
MINWIRFGKEKPKEANFYLYLYPQHIIPSIAYWDTKEWKDCNSTLFHGLYDPAYWAKINLPEAE